MPSWLITGANRGIGFGIVQALLKNESNFVIATARDAETNVFKDLSAQYPAFRFKAVQLDITNQETIDEVVSTLTPLLPNGLDYIINNAGANPNPYPKFEDVDLDSFAEELKLSIIAPLRVTRPFLLLIKKSEAKKIILITSVLGSTQVSFNMVNQLNTYSVARGGLNMLGRKWGASLKEEGITIGLINPGWVNTEMGDTVEEWMAENATEVSRLSVADSAEGVVKVAEELVLEKTASFWNVDGTPVPW